MGEHSPTKARLQGVPRIDKALSDEVSSFMNPREMRPLTFNFDTGNGADGALGSTEVSRMASTPLSGAAILMELRPWVSMAP